MKSVRSARSAHLSRVASHPKTHGGGFAAEKSDSVSALRRLIGAHLLFEDQFYRSGKSTAEDLRKACDAVSPETVAQLAIEASEQWKLRHTPLFMAAALAAREDKGEGLVRKVVAQVTNRADALPEMLAIWCKVKKLDCGKLKSQIPMQIKRGLADAFPRFDAYQLAKYDRAQSIRLRDVMFLTHPKPKDQEQAETWKKLAAGTLESPDTWEVALSAGKDKKATWERLISEKKLGDLAFLRNLRNMSAVGVDRKLVVDSIAVRKFGMILPFQFLAAAREASEYESALDQAMLRAIASVPRLKGSTGILIDSSGSMDAQLSQKGTLTRLDGAAGLAILLRGVCEGDVRVATYTTGAYVGTGLNFNESGRQGMALRDFIVQGEHGGTPTYEAVEKCRKEWKVDRFFLITDEQATDNGRLRPIGQTNYIMNVGTYTPSLDTKAGWETISGFSEAAVKYIQYAEAQQQ